MTSRHRNTHIIWNIKQPHHLHDFRYSVCKVSFLELIADTCTGANDICEQILSLLESCKQTQIVLNLTPEMSTSSLSVSSSSLYQVVRHFAQEGTPLMRSIFLVMWHSRSRRSRGLFDTEHYLDIPHQNKSTGDLVISAPTSVLARLIKYPFRQSWVESRC